jgi:molybdopterin-binding protein
MNRFQGHISEVETSGPLSLVRVRLPGGLELASVVLETPDSAAYLKRDHPIAGWFKETEVILATGRAAGIGVENRIPCRVGQVEAGTLLSRVFLESQAGPLQAVLSTRALNILGLKAGDTALALVKMNEVMLATL